MPTAFFPTLDDFQPTRQTLHLYSQAIGVIPRVHGIPHPKWWHISLKVRPDGLTSDNIPLPGGGALALRLDLRQHMLLLEVTHGSGRRFDLRAGRTGTEMGAALIAAVADFGLEGEYAHERFASAEPAVYEPEAAGRFLTALVHAERVFQRHRAALAGNTGPVQLWPHGFDLAFEWFGSRVERFEENGEEQTLPSQLNLGFSTGEAPYFYSNPWPFEPTLTVHALPAGAVWHTEGWQGTMLPYAALVSAPDAESRLQAFAQAVFDLAAPTLTA